MIFDELELVVHLSYQGKLPKFSTYPKITTEDLIDENVFMQGLSGLYHGTYPDKVDVKRLDEKINIRLTFSL